jgi:uncharacterized membrane protein
LYAVWQQHGMAALVETAQTKPDVFVRVVAHLMPQHVTVNLEADINEEQLQRIVEVARLEQEKRAAARAKAIEAANANQGELVVYKS